MTDDAARARRAHICWTGIVKVQRPIVTSGSRSECLVYNEARTIEVLLVFDRDTMARCFPNGELKAYWHAALTAGGKMTLEAPAPAQPW